MLSNVVLMRDEADSNSSRTDVSRRQYLQMSAGGFTAPFFFDKLSGDRTRYTEIVTQRDADGVAKTKRVPVSWKRNVDMARRVQSNLQNDLATANGVVDVRRTRSEGTFDGRNGLQLTVEVDPDRLQRDIPTEVNGIPVETTEHVLGEPLGCGGFTDNINPAKGGIACDGDTNDDPSGQGTLCLGVDMDSNSADDLVLTAAHLFSDDCSSDLEGTDLAQGGNHYGTVDDWDHSADWAVVDGDDGTFGEESAGKIKDENGVWPVNAWYTKYGLDDLNSNPDDNNTVHAMGTSTGLTSGEVTGTGSSKAEDACFDYDGKGVETDINAAQGDSGGPIYTYNDNGDKAVMVSLINYGYTDVDMIGCRGTYVVEYTNSIGTAFYYIKNKWGITPK